MARVTVEEILAPGYVLGFTEMPLDELRTRRDAATETEVGLSYLRRLVQGRLDIILAEQQRRSEGLPAGDLAGLVDRLPQILSEHVHAPGLGRLPSIMAPGEIDAELLDRIESVVPTDSMAHLPDLSDDQVAGISAGLESVEREVSSQRHLLHEVIGTLQDEIVRRYRSGEASVDTLLA